MRNEEKILLALCAVALVALVIWRNPKVVTGETIATISGDIPDEASTEAAPGGPAYLTYNQPYIWGPPVNNFLPAINATNNGGTIVNSLNDCGCY